MLFRRLKLDRSLIELRRARRRNRLQHLDWYEALYQTYVTTLLVGIGFSYLTSIVGDSKLPSETVARIATDGPRLLGLGSAVVVALAVRSGSHGGPMILEEADVRHVLLAPIHRVTALRGPAMKLIRRWILVGALIGGAAGLLAYHRMGGNPFGWIGSSALFAASLAAFAAGVGLLASGLRLRGWAASLIGGVVVGSAIADVVRETSISPFSRLGGVALWPLGAPRGWMWTVVLALLIPVGALLTMGNISIEDARRRAALVGQLRFAATLFDLRTIVLLRRQLSLEVARSRPLLDIHRVFRRMPVIQRDVASFMRWPLVRLFRLVALGSAAGVALAGFWGGTRLLILVAGAGLFLAALDASESAAQEVDHPHLQDSFPVTSGELARRHAVVAALIMSLSSLSALVTMAFLSGEPPARGVLLFTAILVSLTSVWGAITNLNSESPVIAAPSAPSVEIYGMYVATKIGTPPLIATLGLLPILVALEAS